MAQNLGAFEKVLRVGEGRRIKRLAQQAAYIGTLEPEFEALSDDELRGKTAEFKQRIENGETLEEILFEAYAAEQIRLQDPHASASGQPEKGMPAAACAQAFEQQDQQPQAEE